MAQSQLHLEAPLSSDADPAARAFVDSIRIQYGPPALLGRFFLKAYCAARDRGVTLSFASFEDLARVNAANRQTWFPLFPAFDPVLGGANPDNGVCLLGRNAQGEVVATQAGRLFDWRATTFYDEATSLRLLYQHPQYQKRPLETCIVTAPSAKKITGYVLFSGAAWYRRDYRGKSLVAILPRICRAYAFTRWAMDYTISMMSEAVIKGGIPNRNGFSDIEWAVMLTGAAMGDTRFGLSYLDEPRLLSDLEAFMTSFDTQIDPVIANRSA